MKTHTLRIVLLLLMTLGFGAPSAHAQDKAEGRDFTELFAKTSGDGGSLTLVAAERVSNAPGADRLEALRARSGKTKAEVAKAFLNYVGKRKPSDQGPAGPSQNLDPDEILRKDPVTMVIFPGIFGEFIETRAFEEVFEKRDSAFRTEWEAALAAQPAPVTDPSYSLHDLQEIERPFGDLVSVGSIDDPETGKSLVNVILLRTPPLSLESAGTVSDIADVFGRRVDTFFNVLGRVPNTIGFAGYSMGTTTALEVLSRSATSSWGGNVVGMVSLAGVSFGSTAADVSVNPDPIAPAPAAVQLKLLERLSGQLKLPEPDTWGAHLTRFWNRHYWAKFAVDILPTLKKEGDTGPLPDLKLLRVDRARSMLETAILTATTSFDVSLSSEAHARNVQRWQYMVRRILDGVGELTTDARIGWWSTHVVPSHVKYYSIAGSLTGNEEPPRGGRLSGVLLGSVDYVINLGGYNDYIKAGGSTLNDGQVGMHQARFWPQLSTFLNPDQGPFEAEFLGCFKTHHWGLALRTGVGGTNPFPREALLKALAAKMARDVDEKRNADEEPVEARDLDGAAKHLERASGE